MSLLQRARDVLEADWTGQSTVASRSLYPHQWSWDTAFVAIGRSWYEPKRAMQELEAIFRGQWANGMLRHIRFDPRTPDYFPGPDFWASERVPLAPADQRTSGLTQPPLHARAALEVYHHAGGDTEALTFLRRLFPKLAAQHAYVKAAGGPAAGRLVVIEPDRRSIGLIELNPYEPKAVGRGWRDGQPGGQLCLRQPSVSCKLAGLEPPRSGRRS